MYVDGLREELENFLLDLEDAELSKNTLCIYKTNINNFINYLDSKDIKKFDKKDYIAFRTYLKEIYKISTVNKYVVVINKYLNWLGYKDLKIQQLKVQRKQSVENVPNNAEFKKILRVTKRKGIDDAYFMALVFAYTGIRVSELKYITVEALKKSKVDKCIVVFNKNKYREISLPKWLRRELLNYAKEHKITSGYIFPSPRDKNTPISRQTVWRRIQYITGQARIDKKKGHPHALRHLFGKNYLEYSGDIREVADLLGHNSLDTSHIYTQLSREEKANKIDKFRF